jgi:CRISPR/Cas system-associated protein Cas10 (large subunit of type III CRISPR-Cas system)
MKNKQKYKQLFIGGDLSGIQKFLYNISSKNAAVSLKGRSFYLCKYMDSVCKSITDAATASGATSVRRIYCSGGKFYLITDNLDAVKTAIDQCAEETKMELWKKHMGQLGINICYVPFSENPDGSVNAEGKNNEEPGILWQVVNADFAHQKSQKFKDILQNSYSDFFQPIEVGGNTKVCTITGVESPDCSEHEGMNVLPSVKEQIELGKILRNTQHFKTFEEYADNTNLGILRMDVDGLGKRFINGFKSIKDYQAFSEKLVKFFEQQVGIIQQEEDYKDYLNIIYAGGDDLFIVGRWDKVIDFAERIHQETEARFHDDGISISGGIAIVKPKFPIAKAAELAGEAEEAAKSFKSANGKEKNAFHMLGKTVSWDKEFAYVKSYQQQFVTLIDQFSLSKGILHKIMLYSSIADMNKLRRKQGKAEDYSYIWHISYYLTRYMKRYDCQEVKDFCKTLKDKELTSKNGRNLELIALAARWAELILKDKLK